MPAKKQTFYSSLSTAGKSLWRTLLSERNLRIQLVVASLTLIAGYYFHLKQWEWVAIIFSIALVVSLEIINTAIEEMVNWLSAEYHAQAGKIKDVASGAVLFAALLSILVGLIVFTPYLCGLINS